MLYVWDRISCCAAACLVLGLGAASASATTITLSDESSDATPASTLDATLDLTVLGGNTLQLVVTNDTTAPDAFNMNGVWWNSSSDVSGLVLTSATHTLNGNVFGGWDPVEVASMANGFDTFDFGLTNGTGQNDPSQIQPGESITFLMDISGNCADTLSCTASDFYAVNSLGYLAAAKFVNGPDDPENPGMEDSAFGAAVPEPSTAALLSLGLVGLAAGRRGARRS